MLIVQEVKCPVICNSNRIIGLLLKRWGVLYFPVYFDYFPWEGDGGYSTKFHTGGYAPYPIIPYTICNGKGSPFLHLLFTNGTPFTYLVENNASLLTALPTHYAPSFFKKKIKSLIQKVFFSFSQPNSHYALVSPFRSFDRSQWQISQPFDILQPVKSLPFKNLKPGKGTPFGRSLPCIGHGEYTPGVTFYTKVV